MSTDTHSPPLPFTVANGSRIYAADGEEIAVATKASGKHRRVCDETAVSIVRAVNAHRQLVDALRGIVTEIADATESGDDIAAHFGTHPTIMVRFSAAQALGLVAALRLATGDTNA